jgi:cytochrome c oxidase cbb3-type subunit 3
MATEHKDPNHKDIDPVTGIETMGHEWDGIKELNNPAPRWWLWVWFATTIFSIGYFVVYPSWPTLSGHTGGSFGWTEYKQLASDQVEGTARHVELDQQIDQASLQDIKGDPKLYEYARQAGAAAFRTNCVACHGSGAQGGKGFPNLVDDDWLWGGTLDDISTTLHHGVRASSDPETRQSQMPAWGRDGLLKSEEIEAVASYVETLHLGDKAEQTPVVQKGKEVFTANCAVCHGENGEGGQAVGAPRLNDNIWLYGGDHATLVETVYNARAGVMPAWQGRLSERTIKELTVYVHSLGGGQ